MYDESGAIPGIYGAASLLVFILFVFFLTKQNNKDWYYFTEFKFNFLTSFHLIYTLIFLYLFFAFIVFLFPDLFSFGLDEKIKVKDFFFNGNVLLLFMGFVIGSGWRAMTIGHDIKLKSNTSDKDDERLNIILIHKLKLMIYYLLFGRTFFMGFLVFLALMFPFFAIFTWFANNIFDILPRFVQIITVMFGGFIFCLLPMVVITSLGDLVEKLEEKYKVYKWFFPNAKGGWKYISSIYPSKELKDTRSSELQENSDDKSVELDEKEKIIDEFSKAIDDLDWTIAFYDVKYLPYEKEVIKFAIFSIYLLRPKNVLEFLNTRLYALTHFQEDIGDKEIRLAPKLFSDESFKQKIKDTQEKVSNDHKSAASDVNDLLNDIISSESESDRKAFQKLQEKAEVEYSGYLDELKKITDEILASKK